MSEIIEKIEERETQKKKRRKEKKRELNGFAVHLS